MNVETESVNLLKQIVGILQNNQQTQERVENLLIEMKNENKENHKEQSEKLDKILESQIRQEESHKKQSQKSSNMNLGLYSGKLFDNLATNIRNYRWIGFVGTMTVLSFVVSIVDSILPIEELFGSIFYIKLGINLLCIISIFISNSIFKYSAKIKLEESVEEIATKVEEIKKEYIDVN